MTTLKKGLPVVKNPTVPTTKALQAQNTIVSNHFNESLVFASVTFVMFCGLMRASQQNKSQAYCISSQHNQWTIQPEICHYTLMTSLAGIQLVLRTYQFIQIILEQRKQKALLFQKLHAQINNTAKVKSNTFQEPPEIFVTAPDDTLQLPTRSQSYTP